MPGRRSMIRYWPVPSVVTERTFSIRTGLAASTVTPGSTAPDASLTTPVMAPCAIAAAGTSRTTSRTAADRRASGHIAFLLTWSVVANGVRNWADSHECGGEESGKKTGIRGAGRRGCIGGSPTAVEQGNVAGNHQRPRAEGV